MNKKILGYPFLLSSTMIYGLFGLFSRYTSKFGPFSQGWVRYGIIILVISVLLVSKRVIWKKIQRKDIKWFFLWILPASFQPVITFVAFNHLPLSTTYFLLYSTMVLGGIISGKIFFHEKYDIVKFVSTVFVFVGLILIYHSDITIIKSSYVFLALLSGLIVGFWNTLTKKVSNNYSELQMIFLDSFSTLTIGIIGALVVKETLPVFTDYLSWFWVILFSLAGLSASLLLIRGFRYVEAQVGSLVLPLEILFASIFGYIFFGEVLKFYVYLGGLIIAISSILPNIFVLYSKRKKTGSVR